MTTSSEDSMSEDQNEAEGFFSEVDMGSMADSIPSCRGRQALSDTTPYALQDREDLGHKHRRKKRHKKHRSGPSVSPVKARSEGGSPKKGLKNAFSALGHAFNKVESNLMSGEDYKPYGRHKYANPRRLEELNARIHEEQEKVREEQAKFFSIRQAASQLQAAMDHKELPMGDQCTDDEIYELFNSLRRSISTWSFRFSSAVERGSLMTGEASEFSFVAPNVRDLSSLEGLLASNNLNRRAFIRGWAAYVINSLVLQNMNIWMGDPVLKSFSELEKVFKSAVEDNSTLSSREFHDWRSFTAYLVAQVDLTPPGYFEHALDDGAERVMRVVPPWANKEALSDIRTRLEELFVEALNLSKTLKQQRAQWWFDWPKERRTGEGLTFDPFNMVDDMGNEEEFDIKELRIQPVEFILSPALYKRGDAAGEHYDKDGYCVAKSLVLINPPC